MTYTSKSQYNEIIADVNYGEGKNETIEATMERAGLDIYNLKENDEVRLTAKQLADMLADAYDSGFGDNN